MPRQVTLARRLSPWWRRSRIPWATVLPLGAIVVLAVAAVNERRTVRKLVDGQALLLEDARRAMLMDDLLGTRVPSMRIETLQGEVVDFRREIAGSPTWILNPNACAGCLDHMPKWNRTAPDALGGNLVLVGSVANTCRRNRTGPWRSHTGVSGSRRRRSSADKRIRLSVCSSGHKQ